MAMIKKKTPAAAPKPEFKLQDRIGRFTLEAAVFTEMPEVGIKVLSGILVLACTLNPITENFEYLGLSEAFEGVEKNEGGAYGDIPLYEPEYEEGADSATWTKAG
jgi:hypothetical protein